MQKNKTNDIIVSKIKYREGYYIETKNIDKYGNACSFVFDFSNVD